MLIKEVIEERDMVLGVGAPPSFAKRIRGLYKQPTAKMRAGISAFAPTLTSAIRKALLKRAWQQYKADLYHAHQTL